MLLVDLGMPDGTGLDVIRDAVARFPGCEPLVVSVFGDEENVLASIEAGAVGYIHKDAAPEDIAQTIVEMKAGASPISPMIARRVLAKYRSLQAAVPGTAGAAPAEAALDEADRGLLSAREHEVLTLIARGFSYAEIARLKGLSVHTVQTHIKNLYGKLAVHSKSEAVFEATRLGLLSHPG
ncbi:Response regulator protein VraR [compost metagenome]